MLQGLYLVGHPQRLAEVFPQSIYQHSKTEVCRSTSTPRPALPLCGFLLCFFFFSFSDYGSVCWPSGAKRSKALTHHCLVLLVYTPRASIVLMKHLLFVGLSSLLSASFKAHEPEKPTRVVCSNSTIGTGPRRQITLSTFDFFLPR